MLEFCECRKERIVAYKCGSREQITLFPQSIDEYIGEEHPVRAYDAFIEVGSRFERKLDSLVKPGNDVFSVRFP
jgi:hypothetical protein